MQVKQEKYFFYIILIAAIIFFFAPITRNINFYFRDLFQWTYPAKFFFVEEIQNGKFPLWNPYEYKGVPFAANPSMSVFYPLNIFFLVLPFHAAFKYFIIVHYLLFGIFSYIFLRSIKISPFSSVYASTSLMFSGYLLSIHTQSHFLQSALWLPLILFFYLKALNNSARFRYIFSTSLTLAFQFFAGNPQDVLITVFFLVIIGVVRILRSPQKLTATKTWLHVFVPVGIISLGLSAIQLLPALELTNISSRHGGLTFADATTWSFHPVRLIELLFPFPFGKVLPDVTTYYGTFLENSPFNIPWAFSIYMGLVPPFFIFMSILKGNRTAHLFTFFLIFFILLSFGKYTPVYFILHKFLPGFNLFRYPEKYLFPATFSMGVLCALGCDTILKYLDLEKKIFLLNKPQKQTLATIKKIYTRLIKSALLIVGAGITAYLFLLIFDRISLSFFDSLFKTNKIIMSSRLASTVIEESLVHFIIFSFLALLLFYLYKKGLIKKTLFKMMLLMSLFIDISTVNTDLIAYTSYYSFDYVPSIVTEIHNKSKGNGLFRIYRSPLVQYQTRYSKNKIIINGTWEQKLLWGKNTLQKNVGTIYHLSYCDGYQPLEEEDYFIFFKKLNADTLLNLLNVKYIIARDNDAYFSSNKNYQLIFLNNEDKFKVFENKKCFNRAFLTDNVLYFDNKQKLLDAILKKDFDFSHMVAIESHALHPEKFVGGHLKNGSCEIVAYKPNYVRINSSAETDCFLVLSDTYYPGWKAYIDGKEEPILKANYVMRALFLKTGHHIVEFKYKPVSFKIGAFISLFTVFLLAGYSLYRVLRTKWQHG